MPDLRRQIEHLRTRALDTLGTSLGLPRGRPNLEGRVHTITSDHAHAADRPLWARLSFWLAVAPTLATITAAIVMAKLIASFLRGSSRTRGGAGVGLTYGVAGFALAEVWNRYRLALIQVWRIDTPRGAIVVRIALSPSHPSDVRVGDTLSCWGQPHPDGTFRAYRAYNYRTSEAIVPSYVSPIVAVGAVFWACVLIVIVLQLLP